MTGNNPTTHAQPQMIFEVYELAIIHESKQPILPVSRRKGIINRLLKITLMVVKDPGNIQKLFLLWIQITAALFCLL